MTGPVRLQQLTSYYNHFFSVDLKKVYNLFSEACDEFKDYPNFVVIRSEASDDLISGLVEDLMSRERQPFWEKSKM